MVDSETFKRQKLLLWAQNTFVSSRRPQILIKVSFVSKFCCLIYKKGQALHSLELFSWQWDEGWTWAIGIIWIWFRTVTGSHWQSNPAFICPSADPKGLSASSCCAIVHRGNTWIFTEADRLSASYCPVAEVGLTESLKPLEISLATWWKNTCWLRCGKEAHLPFCSPSAELTFSLHKLWIETFSSPPGPICVEFAVQVHLLLCVHGCECACLFSLRSGPVMNLSGVTQCQLCLMSSPPASLH